MCETMCLHDCSIQEKGAFNTSLHLHWLKIQPMQKLTMTKTDSRKAFRILEDERKQLIYEVIKPEGARDRRPCT